MSLCFIHLHALFHRPLLIRRLGPGEWKKCRPWSSLTRFTMFLLWKRVEALVGGWAEAVLVRG